MRYDKSTEEAMVYAYETFGESIYTAIENHKKNFGLVREERIEFDCCQPKESGYKLTWDKQAFYWNYLC
jgi:type I restriction enzyme M protein